MNTDLKMIGTLRRDDEGKIIFDETGELYVKDGMRVYSDDSLITLQSERDLLRAEVKTLVELGNGVGGTKVSAPDRAAIRENLRKAFAISKERSLQYACVPN